MPQTTNNTPNKRLLLVNCFGALFYMTCAVEWLWAFIPYLPSLAELLEAINRPVSQAPTPNPDSYMLGASLPPVVLVIIGAIVLMLVVALTVYVLVSIPKTVAKTGHTITASTSKKIAAATPRFKRLPEKKRRQLTARTTLFVKLSLVLLPVGASALSFLVPPTLPYTATVVATAALGCLCLLPLFVQLGLSKLLGVSFDKTW